MKKFAVAYLYQEIPKYDRIEIKGAEVRLFKDNKLVCEFRYGLSDIHLLAEPRLGIEVVEAESPEEAMEKVLRIVPYMILEMCYMEIGMEDVYRQLRSWSWRY